MAEPQLNPVQPGQELPITDVQLLGQVSGLADDRVFAELLRMQPSSGALVSKAIVPFGSQASPFVGGGFGTPGTVVSSGSANGSVVVQPFRAIVGSRTSVGAGALANWRDIRSVPFVGTSTSLTATLALASNSSGNPRWDLVYAVVAVDVASGAKNYRVKDTVGNVTTPVLNQNKSQSITVTVQTGTPGATPTIPSAPVDAGSIYNIPLAAVRVPNGFGSLSTVAPQDIREQATVISVSGTTGAVTCRTATGNNDGDASYATNAPWSASSAATRPGVWLPPSMVGGHTVIVEFDVTNASAPSFANGAIVDSAIDWRNRFFVVFASGSNVGSLYANDATAGSAQRVPSWNNGGNGIAKDWAPSNSFALDGNVVSGKATVYYGVPATMSVIGGGATMGLYVEPSDGTLRAAFTGTPGARLWLSIMTSARYPNF